MVGVKTTAGGGGGTSENINVSGTQYSNNSDDKFVTNSGTSRGTYPVRMKRRRRRSAASPAPSDNILVLSIRISGTPSE